MLTDSAGRGLERLPCFLTAASWGEAISPIFTCDPAEAQKG